MKRTILTALALAAAPALAQAQTAPAPPPPVDYAAAANWVCLPGRDDACSHPLPTADLDPAGYGPLVPSAVAADPPIDCFYVYPTVSRDPELNSDLNPSEEPVAATVQFARFASLCKTYAPLYRQATLSAIPRALAGQDVSGAFNLAYGDVVAAWHYYLEHYNRGRPFVLIGHSQGTIHLTRLLASEIENGPAAAHLLSALLIGYAVEVPEGQLVGGSLHRTPLCTAAGQTGCVITLGGGSAPLDSIWYAGPSRLAGPTITWSTAGAPPAPFLHTRGLVTGECRHDGQAGYLAISVNADPNDARTDVIPGDVYFGPQLIPGWGLHLGDTGYAMGDLLRAVAAQRDAWLRAHH
jgi:hypothetical protein